MTIEATTNIARAWLAAFNSRDLEKLLALYVDDAEHYSPKLKLLNPDTRGFIKGKDSLRQWWQGAFDRLPTLRYELVRLTPHEDRVFMEYIRHVTGEDDLYVGELLEIRNGRIFSSAVFHR